MSSHGLQSKSPIRAGEVTVRLARTSEYAKWDRLMRDHHDLGFKRFAGRSLRYIVEHEGRWVCLSGWQTGSFKSAGRDSWIGWQPEQQWCRLHLVANNTRFAMLDEPGSHPNLGSHVLKLICARISNDWEAQYGHGLLVAETFVDPKRHRGLVYDAAGWQTVGETAGYSRKSGKYTEAHGETKRILVKPLRRDARRLLCQGGELPSRWQKKGKVSEHSLPELRSLHEDLSEMRDFRRAQGRKHSLACAFSTLILAQLSRFYGPVAAAQFGANLSQSELEAIGSWRNPKTGRYEPVSKSTLHRVIQHTDPEQLEEVLARYTRSRIKQLPALATDGKRIRGANRNGDSHYETATLVEHGSGIPKASSTFYNKGEELEATRRLLSETDVSGRVITLDSLHSTFESVDLILAADADYMLTLKDNTSVQLKQAQKMKWHSSKVRRYSEDLTNDHGRLEQRHIQALEIDNPTWFDFKQVKQVFRIERDREVLKEEDSASTEIAYGITSVGAERADAQQLLEWNRGHWAVENSNHHIRDRTFLEDASLIRTGNGPSNQAMCNNIALALIFHRDRFDSVPQAQRHFNLNRNEAFEALLSPT